jgi:phenylacetate-CoA ligase
MTDLDNYATPFIRYENGDTAIMSTDLCSCGRNSKMLKEISGRTKDVVYLKNGNGVHGVFFTDIFYELGYDDFKYFTRFQIYQNIKGDFTCRLEITDITLPKKDYDRILSVLSKYGNNVKIELLDKLQNDNSGKFRYVISDIEK